MRKRGARVGALVLALMLGAYMRAQGGGDLGSGAPSGHITATAAQLRALDQMVEFNAPVEPPRPVPFHPTISEAEYQALKASAASLGAKPPAANLTATAPIMIGVDFDGVDRNAAGGAYPPDTHGAVGVDQYVQVTNSRVDAYDFAGHLLMDVSLQSFFGTSEFVFDPRVIYDPGADRWIIMATRTASSAGDPNQRWYVACSYSSDATAGFYVYVVNFSGDAFRSGDWWDYPDLGMDQDAILVTGNIFPYSGSCRFSAVAAIAKNRAYNGLSFDVPVFTPQCATISPPIVLDQNVSTFLIAAPPVGSRIIKYTMTNTCCPGLVTFDTAYIDVPFYSTPPDAAQPGTAAALDTLDSRFVGPSTQIGDFLWNVHSINNFGYAAPRYYQFNTATNVLVQSGLYSASSTSYDWNASIAANAAGDLFTTWSSTDPANGVQAQMLFSGRCHGDPGGVMAPGQAVVTSGTFSAQVDGSFYRWGDYSASALQPFDGNGAWIVNEWTASDSQIWGSHITQIGFSPACP